MVHFKPLLPGYMLTLNDLHLLRGELMDVGTKWYYLGVELGVGFNTLDRIRAQLHQPRDQLLEMLKFWLTNSDNTSWKTLTDALRSQSVGASQLASLLETKYCLVKETEMHESKQIVLAVSKDQDGWEVSLLHDHLVSPWRITTAYMSVIRVIVSLC